MGYHTLLKKIIHLFILKESLPEKLWQSKVTWNTYTTYYEKTKTMVPFLKFIDLACTVL